MKYKISFQLLILFLMIFPSPVTSKKVTITFIHTDHLGTPILATKEDGSVKWTEEYQPFGKQLINEDSDNNIGFTGQKDDKSLGLTYMKARWYQPDIGRFMSPDPLKFTISDLSSFNRYSYVGNNPYKYTDPTGESRVLATFARIAKEPIRASRSFWRDIKSLWSNNPPLVISNPPSDSICCLDIPVYNPPSIKEGEGKKADDSGKNSRHGDRGRAKSKAEGQISDLESQLDGASKKERKKLKQKIKNIRDDANRKKKGEEHSRTKKR